MSLQAATGTAAPAPQRLPEPQFFEEFRRMPSYFATPSLTRQATQMARAERAATLINAGRCTDALQAMSDDGDRYLAQRVAQVCQLPLPKGS